jgi:hypothetical protein
MCWCLSLESKKTSSSRFQSFNSALLGQASAQDALLQRRDEASPVPLQQRVPLAVKLKTLKPLNSGTFSEIHQLHIDSLSAQVNLCGSKLVDSRVEDP